jgi:amino-acid N-acetyltransferase
MIAISLASPNELSEIVDLLNASHLPTRDVRTANNLEFWCARDAGALAGVFGLERFADGGLLRSLAVDPKHRNKGLGKRLTQALEAHCAKTGVHTVILLTETARDFFLRCGYKVINRNDAPPRVIASQEFRSLCPASAICMRKELTQASPRS